MLKVLKILFFFLVLTLFVRFSTIVYAADVQIDYQVEYNLSQYQNNLNSQVNFQIKITNLRSDVYVNKFSISFPQSFTVSNLEVKDDNGKVDPQVTNQNLNTKVEMEFSHPNIGRDSVNNFHLTFNQANLFKINGNVWEVMLPVMESKENGSYKVIVNLPEGTDKKISIAKPRPDSISGRQIIWSNPSTKTIYAVFGDSQLYQANLTYNLKNPSLVPVVVEVAFPPDTSYQKIYFQSISEKPLFFYQDEDGNLLANYFLKPKETKTVNVSEVIEVFSHPREEVVPVFRQLFNQQKKYLLNSEEYWTVKDPEKLNYGNTAADVYSYVVSHLQYAYQRVTKNSFRLGADRVLSNPNQAVCMEFTDLFIALAREKSIYSREIEGYGFSSDSRLRPLSLASDVLHAWPEYYDSKSELWKPIDPTWENTSGIDYLSSFDLNHIVFVIHGKKPDYPLPAGMYKIDNSQDISIKPAASYPEEKKEVIIDKINLPTEISDKGQVSGSFVVKNTGNIYLWDIPVEIKGEKVVSDKTKINITSLAPYEEKKIEIKISPLVKNKKTSARLEINVFQKKLLEEKIIIFPYLYGLAIKIVLIFAGSFIVLFLVKKYVSKKTD